MSPGFQARSMYRGGALRRDVPAALTVAALAIPAAMVSVTASSASSVESWLAAAGEPGFEPSNAYCRAAGRSVRARSRPGARR